MSWIEELEYMDDSKVSEEVKSMDTDEIIDELQNDYEELISCYEVEDNFGDDENSYDADYYDNAADIAELEEAVAEKIFEIIQRKEIDKLQEIPEIYEILLYEGII